MVRHLGRRVTLFAGVFVSAIASAPNVSAEVSAEFSILLTDKSVVDTPIEIVVADGAETATQLLYLSWTPGSGDAVSIDNVTIQAFANDVEITITSSTTPLALRKGTPVPFTLKVAGVPAEIPEDDPLLGSIAVSVVVEDEPEATPGTPTTTPDPATPTTTADDAPTTHTETFEVASFTVSSAAATAKPEDVVFVGAAADGIESETLLSSANVSVRVQNTSDAKADVTVTLGSLRGPRGEKLPPTSGDKPSTDPLAAGATRDFAFVFEGLDSVGDYKGFVDISVDGEAGASTAVTVSRQSSALTLTVSPGVAITSPSATTPDRP